MPKGGRRGTSQCMQYIDDGLIAGDTGSTTGALNRTTMQGSSETSGRTDRMAFRVCFEMQPLIGCRAVSDPARGVPSLIYVEM